MKNFRQPVPCIGRCISVFLGIDKILAKHMAHLFIRDPIAVYAERLEVHDENDTDHFEVSVCRNTATIWTCHIPPPNFIFFNRSFLI